LVCDETHVVATEKWPWKEHDFLGGTNPDEGHEIEGSFKLFDRFARSIGFAWWRVVEWLIVKIVN